MVEVHDFKKNQPPSLRGIYRKPPKFNKEHPPPQMSTCYWLVSGNTGSIHWPVMPQKLPRILVPGMTGQKPQFVFLTNSVAVFRNSPWKSNNSRLYSRTSSKIIKSVVFILPRSLAHQPVLPQTPSYSSSVAKWPVFPHCSIVLVKARFLRKKWQAGTARGHLFGHIFLA